MHDIKIHDVSFSYAGSDKLVLKDINVDVEGGEFVCILGQSGCGKSTLLRLIAGLEDCTTGEILVDGEKIHGASLNRGVVFQDYGLFPWKTAGANITLALKKKFPDWDKNHLKERTIELLKAVDAQVAVQLGEQAKKYNILFFEEPTTPNPKMNKFVCDKLNIPIAQGERIYSRWGYAPYFEDGSIQLIQPDIGNCGGLTEAKKICDLAHIYDVGVQAHVCASPLSTAVALQLEAAIPNFTIHEHHVYNRYDYNKKLCKYDYQPVDGYIAVPDLPGIGNELTDYCFTNGKVTTIE